MLRKPNHFFLATLLFLSSCAVTLPGSSSGTSGTTGSVPIYQGMTVSGLSNSSNLQSPKNQNDINQENPFDLPNNEKLESKIESDLADLIQEQTMDYYARPSETVRITINILNPQSYVILSFNLNGRRYQSFEFREGSTSTRLLMDVTLQNLPGVQSLTIDEIKYIVDSEGDNQIRDVVMFGDQTVEVGIGYSQLPSVNMVSQTVLPTTVNYSIEVSDALNILSTQETAIYFYFFDGETLQKEELIVGNNELVFNKLTSKTLYQYAIVSALNPLDGEGPVLTYYDVEAFYSSNFIQLSVNATKESITYEVNILNGLESGDVTRVELEKNSEILSTQEESSGSFDELLSNNDYELNVYYEYSHEGENDVLTEVYSLTTKTLSKSVPTFTFTDIVAGKEDVTFEYEVTDLDQVGSLSKIELLKGEEVVETLIEFEDTSFANLLSNNDYQLKATYTYDLNDGVGEQTIVVTNQTKTLPKEAPEFIFSNLTPSKESIAFDYVVTDLDQVGSLIKIELIKGDSIIETFTSFDNLSLEGLLSNNQYLLKAYYEVDLNDGLGLQTLVFNQEFTTLAKAAPTFTFTDIVAGKEDVTFEYEVTDLDQVGSLSKIELLKGEEVVETLIEFEDTSFANLLSNNDYQLKATYTYNLNDGVGQQTIVVTNQTKTLSKIAPIIDKNLILVSKTYISVENLIIDLDETGTIKTLKLFKDDILISDISNLNATSFNNLQKNSLYRVFLEFEFNLNEGDENKIIIFNDLVKTKFMEFGSGTTEDPFVITTVDDLIDVKYGLSSNYILANDLDLEGINWTPIGENFFSPFSGKFDGQGYNIDNLKISGTHNYVGLFGWNELGTITNLTLSNVDIDVTGSLDDDIMVGAFVGYNRGFVENLHTLSGKILAKKRADKIGYFGGLIGAHYYLDYIDSNNLHLINPMINLTNNLEVTGVGITNASTGGIVGHIYYGALVEDAINYGQISGDNNVGGIVGSISEYSGWARLTISNSENIGLISGISNVGGLVGNSPYGSRLLIKDSKNFSLIKASGNSTGGLVGFAYSLSILDSINHGNVIGSDYGTGGLLGYGSNGGATISRSKNFGDISGGRILGGLVGGGGIINITNSLNEGSVSGTDEIGGLAGGISSFTLNNSYNNSYIRGNYSVGGLAGRVYGNATIANSFNSGNLLGLDYVGGFIGRIDGSITLMTSYSTGLITGSAYVGGFIGRILGNFYAFNSINFSNVNAKNTNLNVGSILGGSPQTYDFELVYSTGFVFNNDSQISGYNLGNTQISLESIDENFFTNHLQWLDSIWNFSNIDSVNGFFPKII